MSAEFVAVGSLVEVVVRDGFSVLLPCETMAINNYWTTDNAPIYWRKFSATRSVRKNVANFEIGIGPGFSEFTDPQKMEAISKIFSEWESTDKLSLLMYGFDKEEFYKLVRMCLESENK